MKHILILFITIHLGVFSSCGNNSKSQQTIQIEQSDDYSKTQILFSTIEYNLYLKQRARAHENINELKNIIDENYHIYCDGEETVLNSLVNDLEKFNKEVLIKDEQWSLEKLRDLKGQYIMLPTEDDYNPYLYQLWSFEEEMYNTTKTAIDPKLDLYEWGEFQMMVNCMNEKWELVNRHYPSIELFGNNHLGYKIQTMAKIHLQKTMEEFNIAVNNDDYINYNLCDHAILLRQSYMSYLKTFTAQEEILTPFLAII